MSELQHSATPILRGADPREVDGALHASDGVHRYVAMQIAADFAGRWPGLVRFDNVDFGDALEQCLFLSFRRTAYPRVNVLVEAVRSTARLAYAAIGAAKPRRLPTDRVVVLIERPIRLKIFEPIAAELLRRGLAPALIAGVLPELPQTTADTMLAHQLSWQSVRSLSAHQLALSRVRLPLREWHTSFPEAAPNAVALAIRRSFPASLLRGAQLNGLVRRARPHALVAFQEVGVWARIIPAVAKANRIPSLDLPHAEANDPLAAWQLKYDAVLAYGPRSARILTSARIDPSRIHPVGPLRYDALVKRARERTTRSLSWANEPRRVIYASQPVVDRPGLTEAAKRTTYETALALAGSVASAEVIVQPHPNEPIAALRKLVHSLTPPPGVTVRIEESGDLHQALPGAFVLITASSQSVYEATIMNVPSVTTDPGSNNVTYADEGFSVSAEGPTRAVELGRGLLDPAGRSAVLLRAHSALTARFGRLDGHAADRAAAIIAAFVVAS